MVLKAGKSKSVAQASGVGLHAGSKRGGGGRKAVCGQASDEGGKSRQKSFFLWGNGSQNHPSPVSRETVCGVRALVTVYLQWQQNSSVTFRETCKRW